VLIKPISVRLIAYGQKANIAAIKNRAAGLLKEEHGKVQIDQFLDLPAKDVFQEIITNRWDNEVVLKTPTASSNGIVISLPDVHERMTTEWLYELPIAKTCVAFATWISHKDNTSWQLLLVQGRHWSENRSLPDVPS
jgi:hypothetical protein